MILHKIVNGKSVEMTTEEIDALREYENSSEYKIERIADLKRELYTTDYKAIKHFEGWISDADYEPIKVERQRIREEINRLEAELNGEDL